METARGEGKEGDKLPTTRTESQGGQSLLSLLMLKIACHPHRKGRGRRGKRISRYIQKEGKEKQGGEGRE